jgi:hypothetical protein
MRLGLLLELILAIGLGLGLARLRFDNPGWRQMPHDNWVTWSGSMSQTVLAWAILVVGLGTLAERWRGKSPVAWGPGRLASVVLASVALLKILDRVLDYLSRRFSVSPIQPVPEAIREAFTDFYSDHLPFDAALFLLGLGLACWAAPARPSVRAPADGREWAGRIVIALVLIHFAAFRALELMENVRATPMRGLEWEDVR